MAGPSIDCHTGDSFDVTLAFEYAQSIPPCSREETKNTDDTDGIYGPDDTDDADDTNSTDVTDNTTDTTDTDDTDGSGEPKWISRSRSSLDY